MAETLVHVMVQCRDAGFSSGGSSSSTSAGLTFAAWRRWGISQLLICILLSCCLSQQSEMEAKHLSNSRLSNEREQAPANSLAKSIINMLEEQPAVVKVTDDTTLSLLKPSSCLFPLKQPLKSCRLGVGRWAGGGYKLILDIYLFTPESL